MSEEKKTDKKKGLTIGRVILACFVLCTLCFVAWRIIATIYARPETSLDGRSAAMKMWTDNEKNRTHLNQRDQ